jgi:hypothetical protein
VTCQTKGAGRAIRMLACQAWSLDVTPLGRDDPSLEPSFPASLSPGVHDRSKVNQVRVPLEDPSHGVRADDFLTGMWKCIAATFRESTGVVGFSIMRSKLLNWLHAGRRFLTAHEDETDLLHSRGRTPENAHD